MLQLLAPAVDALASSCLTGPITEYDWAEGIALMTVFTMFFIELMAARFDIFGRASHDIEASDPAQDLMRQNEKFHKEKVALRQGLFDLLNFLGHAPKTSQELGKRVSANPETDSPTASRTHNHEHAHGSQSASPQDGITIERSDSDSGEGATRVNSQGSIPGRADDFTYPPGGEDHLGHQRDHMTDDDHFAAQMTALFILEFGVIFHSIFIGLTLAVAGDEFNVLYIVLVFHQTFEGLGLGSRLATAEWPKKKAWMPWALGAAYGFTTPIAIAVGLGVRTTFTPGSQRTQIVNGVFDSISAGILIYTGLVELMAHEFMFNPEMRKASIKIMLFAYLCMCLGAGLMALLGKWA
jgi:solute carrier family 39 (zinc transporter), member 1/2/3